MGGLETREDWAALAMDADRVSEALLTLTWFLRGAHVTAESKKARDVTGTALGIAEVANARADVVASAIAHARDEAPAANESK